MVPSRSRFPLPAPSRAPARSRWRATVRLRVPSSAYRRDAELAPVPHLDRALVAASVLADPDPSGLWPPGPEGRGAAGAIHCCRPGGGRVCSSSRWLQGLHQLVEPASASIAAFSPALRRPSVELFQPVAAGRLWPRYAARPRRNLVAAGAIRRTPVEPVEVALVLHRRGAGDQSVERLGVARLRGPRRGFPVEEGPGFAER